MLQISLLGTFQVMLEGEPLTGFRSDKTRALLAYLAVDHGRVHRREALATLLWGESATTKDARVSLRSALYNLRQTLAPVYIDNEGQEVPLLDVTRNTIRFNVEPPACWVDTDAFMTLEQVCQAHPHTDLVRCASCIQRLTRMVGLYRGDFLAGLTLPDSLAFEDWRLVQQEIYHRQMLTALGVLVAHYRVLGAYDQVVRYARRQIALEPWREEGHRALMEALALSGQRSAALAQYESCCQILQTTVGVAPEAETVTLIMQIRESELGWDSAVTEPENPYKGLRAFVEEDAGDFFGREAMVARLLRQIIYPALDEEEHPHMGELLGEVSDQHPEEGRELLGEVSDQHPEEGRELLGEVSDRHPEEGRELLGEVSDRHPEEGRELLGEVSDRHPLRLGQETGGEQKRETGGEQKRETAASLGGEQERETAAPLRDERKGETGAPLRDERKGASWRARFLAVVGPSGSGKSSLVRAGLIPALRRSPDPWLIATMVPGNQPMAELAAALVQAIPALGQRTGAGKTLVSDYLFQAGCTTETVDGRQQTVNREQKRGLAHLLADHVPAGTQLLLVVDQAEELFNPHVDPIQRDDFTRSLLAALRAPHSPLYVIVTLRADAYDMPLSDPDWGPLFAHRVEVTLPLTPEALHRAIVAPAHRVGKYIQPALEATLVADAGRSPGALPLLQYVLTELYEQCAGQTMTLAQYQALGGLAGALVQRVDALYDSLLSVEQTLARQIFLRLVTPGRMTADGRIQPDTRRRVLRAELAALTTQSRGDPRDAKGCDLDTLLDLFSRYRLLTLDHDQATGAATVELAHEALIVQWDRLRRWLAVQRDDMRQHQRFVTLTEAWEQAERDPSFLITGQQLQGVEAWASATAIVLTAAEADYLRASQEAYAARLEQEAAQQAREAALARKVQSLYLTTSAQLALQERNTDLALALTVAANRIPDSPSDVRLMLAEAAYAPGTIRRFVGHTSQALCVALSPDGHTLLSGGADATVILWDVQTGEVLRQFTHHDTPVHSVAFLPSMTPGLGEASDRYPRLGQETAASLGGEREGDLLLGEVSDRYPRLGRETAASLGGEQREETGGEREGETGGEREGVLLLGEVSDRYPRLGRETAASLGGEREGETGGEREGETGGEREGETGGEQNRYLSRVLSAAMDTSLLLWNLSGDLLQRLEGHTAPTRCLAVNAEGTRALSGAEDGRLCWWDLASGRLLRQWAAHPHPVCSVAIAPSGMQAISGDTRGNVSLWDVETGDRVYHWPAHLSAMDAVRHQEGHFDAVWSVAFSPDGQAAISAAEDESALLWDLEAGALKRRLKQLQLGLFSVAFLPNGREVLLGTIDGRVVRQGITGGDYDEDLVFVGHTGRVTDLVVSPDGRTAFSSSADGTLRQWDLQSGAEVRRLDYAPAIPATMDLSADGSMGVTGFWDGDLLLWDYASGAPIRHLQGHTETLFAGARFSPDGRWLLSGGGAIFTPAKDPTLRWWDVTSGRELQQLAVHTRGLYGAALSPDGRVAVSAGKDGKVYRWDLAQNTHTLLLDIAPQIARSLAFSPDGQGVLVGLGRGDHPNPDYAVRLLNLATGEVQRRDVGHQDSVGAVAFSPDGRRALSGDHGKGLILWDIENGRVIHRLIGHTGSCMGVTFSADGCQALSASNDHSVILWDLVEGTALHRFWGHKVVVFRAIFGPRGDTVLSVSSDGTVREWRIDATTEDLLAWIANHRYVPELTEAQRAQYNIAQ
jgi:WD40 repeat protein/DNA-binding SARP family transcriptional activator